MRSGIAFMIAGLVFVAAGIAVVSGKLTYTHKSEVANVGDVSLNVDKDSSVPKWIGIAGLVLGGSLVLVGAVRKS